MRPNFLLVLVCFFFINSIADDVLPTLDTYVDSDFPTQSFSNDSALKLVDNRLSQQASDVWLLFDLSSIQEDWTITAANLSLSFTENCPFCDQQCQTDVYLLYTTFDNTLNWNSAPAEPGSLISYDNPFLNEFDIILTWQLDPLKLPRGQFALKVVATDTNNGSKTCEFEFRSTRWISPILKQAEPSVILSKQLHDIVTYKPSLLLEIQKPTPISITTGILPTTPAPTPNTKKPTHSHNTTSVVPTNPVPPTFAPLDPKARKFHAPSILIAILIGIHLILGTGSANYWIAQSLLAFQHLYVFLRFNGTASTRMGDIIDALAVTVFDFSDEVNLSSVIITCVSLCVVFIVLIIVFWCWPRNVLGVRILYISTMGKASILSALRFMWMPCLISLCLIYYSIHETMHSVAFVYAIVISLFGLFILPIVLYVQLRRSLAVFEATILYNSGSWFDLWSEILRITFRTPHCSTSSELTGHGMVNVIRTDDLSQKEIFVHTFGSLYGDKQICTATVWREFLTCRFIYIELMFDVVFIVVALLTNEMVGAIFVGLGVYASFFFLTIITVPYNNRIPYFRMFLTLIELCIVSYFCYREDEAADVWYWVVCLLPLLLLVIGLFEKLFCSQLMDNYLETEIVALERDFPVAIASSLSANIPEPNSQLSSHSSSNLSTQQASKPKEMTTRSDHSSTTSLHSHSHGSHTGGSHSHHSHTANIQD